MNIIDTHFLLIATPFKSVHTHAKFCNVNTVYCRQNLVRNNFAWAKIASVNGV